MIHYLITLIVFAPPLKTKSIDTLDYWQVYYNKETIQEFNEARNKNIIQLKPGLIKNSDSLCIKYFSKNICNNCSYTLRIPTEEGINFFEIPRSTKTISLSLKNLMMM